MSDSLRVAAAAIVVDGQLLVVAKHAAPEVFYLPGGKPDPGEDDLAALHREVREELGAGLTDVEPFAVLHGTADLEDVPMELVVFRAALDGEPRRAAEIAAVAWFPADDVQLASVIATQVVPRLQAAALLDAAR